MSWKIVSLEAIGRFYENNSDTFDANIFAVSAVEWTAN